MKFKKLGVEEMSKGNSENIFEVRFFSKSHFRSKKKDKSKIQMYDGKVRKNKGKYKWFHSAGDLLKVLEESYFDKEKERRKK